MRGKALIEPAIADPISGTTEGAVEPRLGCGDSCPEEVARVGLVEDGGHLGVGLVFLRGEIEPCSN
jgi:hypothetical protein